MSNLLDLLRLKRRFIPDSNWWSDWADSITDYAIKIDNENKRLRNAIRRHRENVWGERGGIYHDEDMELYAELGEQELQTDE